ncbi:HAD hydrolase-like protein [Paenibacillus sp. 1001270B_150601_E10]|uniref:HAD family hydrolase n=1 Tax=Paenibacillus sp. 1001270B_150601_E10 TaxID=2787079 RepID=UPI00189EB2DB
MVLGAAAEQCLFVGDHPINDVQGASEAGLQAIWYKGNKSWDDSLKKPKMTIEQLDELIHILKGISSV